MELECACIAAPRITLDCRAVLLLSSSASFLSAMSLAFSFRFALATTRGFTSNVTLGRVPSEVPHFVDSILSMLLLFTSLHAGGLQLPMVGGDGGGDAVHDLSPGEQLPMVGGNGGGVAVQDPCRFSRGRSVLCRLMENLPRAPGWDEVERMSLCEGG